MIGIHFLKVCRKVGMSISLLVLPFAAWAQQDDAHAGHDAQENLHAEHGTENSSATTEHDHETMERDQMRMQGGTAPENARDPHAYSGGYTLTEGPYARPGPRQLRLADERRFRAVLGDRVEYDANNETATFDLQGWYGNTYNRLVMKLEGEVSDGRLDESGTDVLWSRAWSAYFDTQLGVRFDQYDEGEGRQWLALGVQGLAPYWFELDMTAYVGEGGRSAFSVEAEYELLFTQRLILQPRAELTFYGKDDAANRLGSGLSKGALGLRLRYEISRQVAPYMGVEWTNAFGQTADYSRAGNTSVRDTRIVAGVRFWF